LPARKIPRRWPRPWCQRHQGSEYLFLQGSHGRITHEPSQGKSETAFNEFHLPSPAAPHSPRATVWLFKLGTHVVIRDSGTSPAQRVMNLVESLARHATGRPATWCWCQAAPWAWACACSASGSGRARWGLRQACAAVGAGHLMGLIHPGLCGFIGVVAAQVLLTHEIWPIGPALCLRTP